MALLDIDSYYEQEFKIRFPEMTITRDTITNVLSLLNSEHDDIDRTSFCRDIPFASGKQIIAVSNIVVWYKDISREQNTGSLRNLISKIFYMGSYNEIKFVKSMHIIVDELKMMKSRDSTELKLILILAAQKVVDGTIQYILPVIKRWIGNSMYRQYEKKMIDIMFALPNAIIGSYRGKLWTLLITWYSTEKQYEDHIHNLSMALDDPFVTGGYHLDLLNKYKKAVLRFPDMTPPRMDDSIVLEETVLRTTNMSRNCNGKRLFIEIDNVSEYTVEQMALNHYAKQGYKGLHAERKLPHLVFNLLYKTQIREKFIFHETQEYPLDYFQFCFSKRIDLSKVDDWVLNWNVESNPIKELKKNISFEDVSAFINGLGFEKMISLFSYMLINIRITSYGFPDLFLYKEENIDCLFVEVKSASDRISPHQMKWGQVLNESGIKSTILHVK